jgi:hypothetical protein
MECGSNYARGMASYSLLLTYSGFSYDMTKLEIGFAPIRDGKYFWSLDKAWGVFEQTGKTCRLDVLYGTQKLGRLRLGLTGIKRITLNDTELSFKAEGNTLVLEKPIDVKEGQKLSLVC